MFKLDIIEIDIIFSRLLASPSWIDLLFRIVEARDPCLVTNLPTQVLSVRLLSSVLPYVGDSSSHSSAPSCHPARLQDRIFHLTGHSALMCRVDGSHFGDQGLLQKVEKLTATLLQQKNFFKLNFSR